VGGALAAAPLAKDIMMMVQQRDPASRPALVPKGAVPEPGMTIPRKKPDIPAKQAAIIKKGAE
jgi:hypothetical protein